MRRSKRIASLLLAVCMVWGLLPQLSAPKPGAACGPGRAVRNSLGEKNICPRRRTNAGSAGMRIFT